VISLKKYFFDLDGTITKAGGYGLSEINVPWWIISLTLFFYKPKINEKARKIINKIRENKGEVLIITARPEKTRKITEKYLQKSGISFDKIFFVNPGPESFIRKIDKVEKEKGFLLFENSKKVRKEAEKRGLLCLLI
jgi:uncharacterized HAD superfamily protein